MDQNKLKSLAALNHTVISADGNTDGIVIDTQGARDINFLFQLHAGATDDVSFAILEADDAPMAAPTVVPAADVAADKYNEVISPTPPTDKIFSYQINRTAHKRFVKARVIVASGGAAEVSAVAVLGFLTNSQPTAKNPS